MGFVKKLNWNYWWIDWGEGWLLVPPPQQDQILSFSHTFQPKRARIGGRRPNGKSWIRNWVHILICYYWQRIVVNVHTTWASSGAGPLACCHDISSSMHTVFRLWVQSRYSKTCHLRLLFWTATCLVRLFYEVNLICTIPDLMFMLLLFCKPTCPVRPISVENFSGRSKQDPLCINLCNILHEHVKHVLHLNMKQMYNLPVQFHWQM